MIIDSLPIKTLLGDSISKEDAIKKIIAANKDGYNIYIGTDSQKFTTHVSFVTSICLYKEREGGFGFFLKEKVIDPSLSVLRVRLLNEALRSIDAAITIQELLPDAPLQIHLDVGIDIKRSKSAKYQTELVGLINAQGWECKTKPDSWVITMADRFTKS